MHLLAMRRDVYEKNPFIASSLFDALCASLRSARAFVCATWDAELHVAVDDRRYR